MILSLLFDALFQPVAVPTPPAPATLCRSIDQMRGTNVPIAPAKPSTDIAHALAVAIDGRSVGWIVFRRDGAPWYFDGPIMGKRPERADSARALNALGIRHVLPSDVGAGGMISLPGGVNIPALVNAGLGVYSCF